MTTLPTPSQRMQIAEIIAMDWQTICSSCNIEPSIIINNLHAGSTPRDQANEFIKVFCNRSLPISTLINACNRRQFASYAKKIGDIANLVTARVSARAYMSRVFPPYGIGHSMLKTAACSLYDTFVFAFRFSPQQQSDAAAQSNTIAGKVEFLIEKWYSSAACVEDLYDALVRWKHTELIRQLGLFVDDDLMSTLCMPPVAEEQIINIRSDKKNYGNTVETGTMAAFVQENGSHYHAICFQMNETSAWKLFLRQQKMLSSDSMAKMVTELSQMYSNGKGNPTDSIFKLISINDYGKTPINTFMNDLMNLDVNDVTAAVHKYNKFRATKEQEIETKNQNVYEANVGLREFLINNDISTHESVDDDLSKLCHKDIGVTKPDHLKRLEFDDILAAGFSRIQSRTMVQKIQKMK